MIGELLFEIVGRMILGTIWAGVKWVMKTAYGAAAAVGGYAAAATVGSASATTDDGDEPEATAEGPDGHD